MSEQDNTPQETIEEPVEIVNPLSVGYWRHLVLAIVAVLLNLGFLVGLLSVAYGVYQHANSVAEVTPAKRLAAVEKTLQDGKGALLASMAGMGIHTRLNSVGHSFDTHRHFYQQLINSEESFSKLMHLQQNSVTHFATIIGQSVVWQQRYTQNLLALPGHSAHRQFVLKQTSEALHELPALAN